MATEADKLKLYSLNRKREKYIDRLNAIHTLGKRCYDALQAKQLPTPADKDSFVSRFKRVEDDYQSFDAITDEMMDLNAKMDPADQLDIKTPYQLYEEKYFEVVTLGRLWNIKNVIPQPLGQASAPNQSSTQTHVRLPRIEIEPFDGQIEKWPNFFALFNTLIHNNPDYSRVEKFTHLRSLLRSHALSLVESFAITSTNYNIAFEMLVNRFQNTRLLGANHIEKMLSFRQMPTASHAALLKFLDVFNSNVNALKTLGIQDLSDFIVLQMGLRNLPESTRLEFENTLNPHTTPTFANLIAFIQDRIRILEMTPDKPKIYEKSKPKISEKPVPKTYPHARSSLLASAKTESNNVNICPKCRAPHKLFACEEFKSLPLGDRHAFISAQKLCVACLGFHHVAKCASKSVCRECKTRNHNTLLHNFESSPHKNASINIASATAQYSPLNAPATASSAMACNLDKPAHREGVLLGTAIIHIEDVRGIPRPIRAIFDSGSQVSIISESCVQKLGLVRKHNPFGVIGIGNSPSPTVRGTVTCTISSKKSPNTLFRTHAHILKEITAPQPNFIVEEVIYDRFKNLPLADPTFHKRSKIEFLLGADLYAEILAEPFEVIKGQPSAIKTVFGWILSGPVRETKISGCDNPISMLTCCEQLEGSIRKFWEIEEVNVPKPLDPDDVFCENHFVENYSRDDSGRYSVSLPFTSNNFALPNTRSFAMRSLINLEKRLKRQPDTFAEYRRYMDEFIKMGYMIPAKKPADYVIPHHCVFKESSSTTKVRTVFNASFRYGSESISLNDVLLRGPKLQKDICHVLSLFRLGAIVLCCDVRQMYLQVKVTPEQRVYQHIFYRPNPNGDVIEFELTTLVFGLKPSAFLAQRTLKKLVEDEGEPYTLASDAILNQTFVDNVCQSVDTVEDAITLQKELVALFGLGGFSLRKWASNCQKVLDQVPVDHREHALVVREDDEDHCIKILGLQYEPSEDCFSYTINITDSDATKRGLMSQVARIYDPLGWLGPVVFVAKALIQQTWQSGLEWDEPLPPPLRNPWEEFYNSLPSLKMLKIPRHMPVTSKEFTTQLIGFCDASTLGYAAVIYVRTETRDGNVRAYLLIAKSKLAPIKTVSVPRLELCGALLLSQLLNSLSPIRQQLGFSSVHLFTDSSTALSWIQTSPHKLKTFVSNRVVQILEHSQPSQWAHVLSKDNPADCASRGLAPNLLQGHEIWWKGPPFIYQPLKSWASAESKPSTEIVLSEYKTPEKQTLHGTVKDLPILVALIDRVSNLCILQRIVARILRFVRSFKARKLNLDADNGPLTPKELRDALNLCVRATQQFYYANEIDCLNGKKEVPHHLQKLTPFLDEEGFLRVGGRLKYSSLPYSAKHPLILPRQSRLAALLCDYFHRITLHGGPRVTQSLLQHRFWIISIRQLLRMRIHQCSVCYKMKARPIEPLMSDLPPVRIRECRAFLNTGVDLAGPLTIKESHRRKAPRSKGYIVVFVCLATRAVHLEFTSALSTPAFLATLDRFVARRGLCAQIFSDCATNFKGASSHFHEIQNYFRSANTEISDHLSNRSIKWNFITPAAPHQGGIWESGVKSAKHHLLRIIGPLVLTFEEMTTLLSRIEAVLNSRPLGSVSNDPNDGTDYLSPGHFLIGTPLLSAPELDIDGKIENLRDRYQILQKASQCFWKRWSKDYLQTLIPRQKWTQNVPNLRSGDVVYIKTPNTAPLHWPIGRIEETYPGIDGIVRNVRIRTSTGTYVRPVQKLVALPPVDAVAASTESATAQS